MIRCTELAKARYDRSVSRFHYHWRIVHSALVEPCSEIKGYFQNHEIDPAVWGFKPCGYNGTIDAWFDGIESVRSLLGSEYFLKKVIPDEYNFADILESMFYMVEDRFVEPQPFVFDRKQVKAILLLNRREETTLENFASKLEHDLVPQIFKACPLIIRAAVSATVPEPDFTRGSPPDVQLALWFRNIADYDASAIHYGEIASILDAVVIPGSITSLLVEPVEMPIAPAKSA